MKILYIGGFELPNRNAAAQRVIAIAKTIRQVGYEVEFIGLSRSTAEIGHDNEYEGFKFFSLKYPTSLMEWLYHITQFIPLKRIRELKPDAVVLYNFPALAQKRIINYCHNNGIKVIVDLTEWYAPEGHSLRDIIKKWDSKKRMYKYNFCADGVIAISKYLYDYYKERVKTFYIPATVDLQDNKWNRNRKVEIHKPIRLVYAGSPGSGKKDKLDVLVKAVVSQEAFTLDVIGVSKEQFLSNFGGSDLGDNVKFHGRLSHLEAIKRVCDSDFEVIIRDDNLVTRAGFPTKFVEAYSCGTPVIATLTSNICDYLIDGANGFIVNENRHLEQVLDNISKMNDSELLSIKGNAMKLVDFDYRNYVKEIHCLLS